jgi:GNAT superfamily N-acetyltransferase
VSSIQIRPFHRSDREQLTELVNAHVGVVVPGVSVSVNTVMSQLEREPGEAIVDPWVTERRTLVAVEREAIVAGAHLLRYDADERVGDSYRDAGEIRWLVCGRSATDAGLALVAACVQVLDGWGVHRQYADGSLPGPATYGVPSGWPHIREIYVRAGFVFDGHVEIVLVAAVDDLPTAAEEPFPGLAMQRSVGEVGTRFSALLDGEEIGMIEVATDLTGGGARSRFAGWSDIGNLHVREEYRRRGIATWLLGCATDWLRLGEVRRLIAYARPSETDELAFLSRHGFRELMRTERGWSRESARVQPAR